MRLSDSELSFHSQQNFLKYTHSSAPPPAKNNLLESGVESPRFFGIQNVIYFATSYCFNERLSYKPFMSSQTIVVKISSL